MNLYYGRVEVYHNEVEVDMHKIIADKIGIKNFVIKELKQLLPDVSNEWSWYQFVVEAR